MCFFSEKSRPHVPYPNLGRPQSQRVKPTVVLLHLPDYGLEACWLRHRRFLATYTALFQAKYDFHNKVHFLAWIAAQMVRADKATIAGVTFVVAAPKDISAERLGYDLYVNIPVNVARTVYSFMGSDKLRMQLEEGSSDADKIGAITFLKRSLSLDLKTSRAIALMKLAFVEFQRGSYLHLALLAKARSWWLRNTLGPKEHEQVVQVLAAEVNFKPGSTPAPLRYRQQVVDRDQLLKDELIVSIRRHNEENKALENSRKS